MPNRLVLFDIDGTLMSAGGASRRAIKRAMEEVFGPVPQADGWVFAGKTDPQLSREVLRHAGHPDEAIEGRLDALFDRYLAHLAVEMPRAEAAHLKPGVAALLGALADEPGVLVGLLTGNLEAGARLKVDHFGIGHHFRLGAYGSDAPERPRLPAIAVARAEALVGTRFSGKEVVIIGDTEHDIRCGSAIGARAIGVCTGMYAEADLAAHGADHLFCDLADTPRVLRAILD